MAAHSNSVDNTVCSDRSSAYQHCRKTEKKFFVVQQYSSAVQYSCLFLTHSNKVTLLYVLAIEFRLLGRSSQKISHIFFTFNKNMWGKTHCCSCEKALIIYLFLRLPKMSQVTLTRNGRVQEIRSVDYGPAAPLATIPCPKCPMTFLNPQGLGNHIRNRHPPVVGVSIGEAFKRSSSSSPIDLPWEGSGSGRCWVVQVQFEIKAGGGGFPSL